MAGVPQISTDLKKWIDATFHAYLPKVKKLRTLFAEQKVDPTQITNVYTKMSQSYAESTGYSGYSDTVMSLADGAQARIDDFGTEDGTSTQVTKAIGFRIDRKLLNSAMPFQQEYVARHSLELLNSIENSVNGTLATDMSSNAATTVTVTGGTWATTGDPVSDINNAKNSFIKVSGGIPADFCAIHPDDYTQLANDYRFQSTLYSKGSSVLDQGVLTPKPLGLDWVVDTALTAGTSYIGKKGMFGRLLISEDYKVYEKDEGIAGKTYSAAFSFVDQYPLPYYLLKLTGI